MRLSSAASVRKRGVRAMLGRGRCWQLSVAMHKTWIEAALNGPWSRGRQPGIPDTVEAIVAEGITCAAAGACIIHVHA